MSQTQNAENPATETVLEPEVATAGSDHGAVDAAASKAKDPVARLKSELLRLEDRARAVAKKRLAGTKAEELLQTLPARAEEELDALLDRVGLVRKARLEVVEEAAAAEATAPAPKQKTKKQKAA